MARLGFNSTRNARICLSYIRYKRKMQWEIVVLNEVSVQIEIKALQDEEIKRWIYETYLEQQLRVRNNCLKSNRFRRFRSFIMLN